MGFVQILLVIIMIKTIIFDLDGVLVDTKIIHYKALNAALKFYQKESIISYSDHIKNFDGLTTKSKLKILNKSKKLNPNLNKKVIDLKQKYTKKILVKEIKYNKNLFNLFKKLSKEYSICVATNAVRDTLEICLAKLEINSFINYKISNEEVKNSKPHPEIYLRCMVEMHSKPSETLIIEDSYIGRKSALESGGILFPIKNLSDVNYKRIKEFIKDDIKTNKSKSLWSDKTLNVLVPMAGAGSRFSKAGYTFPKPLIEIDGKPMIQLVIESLGLNANYIFIVQKEHQKKYNISSILKILCPGCKVIFLDKVTEGAASTSLIAKKYINNSNPLLISNSDQFIEWDSSKIMYKFYNKKIDGGILVFDSIHPKWSYAKVGKNGFVNGVAEKKVISRNATVGVYYWKKGKDYITYAEKMIKKNKRVNNEFYICPVYNEAIVKNKKIIIEKVDKMWGLGTPEDLDFYIKKKIFNT